MRKTQKDNLLKFILLFFIISLLIRIIPIFFNAISFHYDMARDAFVVKDILEGDFKIQGPPTSTPGLYHGVLYYYLLTPFYLIGAGDPRIAVLAVAIWNSLTIIPIMLLTQAIFKKRVLTLLSGIFYIFAFETTQYALWLSNPSPAILTVSLFFLGLWLWKEGNIKGFYLAIVSAALSSQFQLFLSYLFVIILIFKFVFKIKIKSKEILNGILIGFLILSSFIVSLIKFNSFIQVLGGFSGITTSSQFDFRVQFTDYFFNYLNRFADIFINNFFPTNVLLGGLLGAVALWVVRKNKFILFCLLINSLLFLFGGHNSAYVNVGMVTPAILSIVFLVNSLSKFSKVVPLLLVVLIISSNIYIFGKTASRGQLTLVIPKDMILRNEFALIDKTYQIAGGKPFSINSLTLPVWTNTTWSYLYSFYGKKTYGYTPIFTGRDQVGLYGEEQLQKDNKPQETAFLIIEPANGIPTNLYNEEIQSEDGKTKLIQEFKFGEIKLQRRAPINYD